MELAAIDWSTVGPMTAYFLTQLAAIHRYQVKTERRLTKLEEWRISFAKKEAHAK